MLARISFGVCLAEGHGWEHARDRVSARPTRTPLKDFARIVDRLSTAHVKTSRALVKMVRRGVHEVAKDFLNLSITPEIV